MLPGLLALCVAFLLPGHYPPWVSFQNELLAAAGAAAVATVALASARDVRWPALAAFATATAAVPLTQAITGQILFSSDGTLAALYLVGFGLSVATGAALARSRRDDLLDGLAGVFLAAALASVGLALAQWLELPELTLWRAAMRPGGRPFANLGQPNHLATLLMLGLVGAGWLFQRRYLHPTVLALAAAFLCSGLAMTQSRTGLLATACLLAWLIANRDRASLRVGRPALLATGLLFALLALAWPSLSNLLFVSAGLSLEQQATAGPRLKIWLAMLDAIQRQPWLGYGWNQVVIAQGLVAADQPAIGYVFEYSHNLVLDLLVWNGVPLGLALVAGLVWWFWRAARACREAATAFLIGAIGVVFLHAMVEYPLAYAYFLLPLGLMMGAVDALNDPGSGLRVPRWFTAGFLAAAVVLGAIVAWEYLLIEEDYRRMRMEVARIGHSTEPAVAMPAVNVLTQPVEFIRFARTPARRDMPPEQLAWMRKVADRSPHPSVLLRYAQAAGINGQPEAARLALVRLCKTSHPPRCEEAKVAWRELIEGEFPELARVPLP